MNALPDVRRLRRNERGAVFSGSGGGFKRRRRSGSSLEKRGGKLGRREVRGADSAAPVWRMILRAASNGSSGEATPPEPLQINKTTSSWPSWPSSLSSSLPSSPSWLSSPWHPHGFELTSTSRGMLGDRPVRSLDSDPNRFAEICRLFFSVVPNW